MSKNIEIFKEIGCIETKISDAQTDLNDRKEFLLKLENYDLEAVNCYLADINAFPYPSEADKMAEKIIGFCKKYQVPMLDFFELVENL